MEPHTASEPSGQELVIVGMAGRRNGPPLSTRYDDDYYLRRSEGIKEVTFFGKSSYVSTGLVQKLQTDFDDTLWKG